MTPNQTKFDLKQIAFWLVILGFIAIAIFQTMNAKPSLSQINQAAASERVCSINQFKDCTIDEQNGLVANLNTDLEAQNKLIVDLSANLEKAKTNKTNIENQKVLVISSRDAKLTK